jgi:glycosyltransferase involved in cell wall biosynthesis
MTLRVAEAGIRGVPANYGGSETAVEEVGRRLADDGVEVVVYCRRHKSPFPDTRYKGMRRVVLPSIPTFNLDTISHSTLSSLHMLARDSADVIHFHGMGNALCLPFFFLSRKKTVITIDGPDWERPKWGPIAKKVLRLSATLAVRWADHLVIDNHPSIDYFKRTFALTDDDFTYIPYGADLDPPAETNELEALGLTPRGYLLFVGALVPDKGPDVLLDAYARVGGDLPLVVVGDSPFAEEFRRGLDDAAARDPRVRMLGYVYGDAYRQLVANAYAYVHPPRNEGTSPALLQAMGYHNCIVSSDIVEAREVFGDAALEFACGDPASLAAQLERVLADEGLVAEYRDRAVARVREKYNWDDVAETHRRVYERALAGRG